MAATRAIVRPPGRTYPEALTRHRPPLPVDLALALSQQRAYVGALRACGLDVVELPPDDHRPDAVFVQDPMLVIGGRAIRLAPAAPSREGEADALAVALAPFLPIVSLQPPATLDGGDVMVADDHLFVGLSTRTNRAACDQLASLSGLPVTTIPVPDDLLHLLSGCTYLGHGRLLAVERLGGLFPQFEAIVVPEDEAAAANVLVVGLHVIVPAGYPRVAAVLADAGFEVHPVDSSEFEKRDGGVTCRALLF